MQHGHILGDRSNAAPSRNADKAPAPRPPSRSAGPPEQPSLVPLKLERREGRLRRRRAPTPENSVAPVTTNTTTKPSSHIEATPHGTSDKQAPRELPPDAFSLDLHWDKKNTDLGMQRRFAGNPLHQTHSESKHGKHAAVLNHEQKPRMQSFQPRLEADLAHQEHNDTWKHEHDPLTCALDKMHVRAKPNRRKTQSRSPDARTRGPPAAANPNVETDAKSFAFSASMMTLMQHPHKHSHKHVHSTDADGIPHGSDHSRSPASASDYVLIERKDEQTVTCQIWSTRVPEQQSTVDKAELVTQQQSGDRAGGGERAPVRGRTTAGPIAGGGAYDDGKREAHSQRESRGSQALPRTQDTQYGIKRDLSGNPVTKKRGCFACLRL